ncbi:MAG: NUDIX domain-containing protein [Muribaculum sp.]|nr:NUDIX domain-containing protein [Muribaculaceae bacterium]MCM1080584.1 NUDIX domain-containing protein [Muribaculum sp.]
MASDELFPIVNEKGEVTGCATRGECHGGSMLLHPVVHLHVLNNNGLLYLQKRAMNKDIQPGKWDTAVGGHIDYKETVAQALARESREELGIDVSTVSLYTVEPYVFQSSRERELVNTFIGLVPDGTTITPDPDEIETGRFWSLEEIDAAIGQCILTPNFEQEYSRLRNFIKEITPTNS